MEIHCLYVKDLILKRPTIFEMKNAAHLINVLLEFQKLIFGDTVNKEYKSRLKKFPKRARTLIRGTNGFVGYELYSAVYKSISPQSSEAVATDKL